MVDLAIKLDVPLFGAGDLVDDQRPVSATVAAARDGLDRLESAGIPFYYIQGNHEWCRPPWFSVISRTAQHLHGQSVEVEGSRVVGIDYVAPAAFSKTLAGIPDFEEADILLCHQSWRELLGFADLMLVDVPSVPVIVTGDQHEHKHLELVGTDGRELDVYSPGSMCLQAINEEPLKQAWLLCEEGFSSFPLPSRPVYSPKAVRTEADLILAVSTLDEELDKVYDEESKELPQDLQTPIYYVELDAALPGANKQLSDAVGERAFLFTRLINRAQGRPFDQNPGAVSVRRDLASHLPAFTEPGPVRDICSQLLTAGTLEAAKGKLAELRNSYLGDGTCSEKSDQ